MTLSPHTNDMFDEEWRPYPHAPQYEVSNRGRVALRLPDGSLRIKKLTINCAGYPVTTMGSARSARTVHVLVLETFAGPRPAGMVSRHLNDIKADNRIENLRWGTCGENTADIFRNRKVRRLHSKLTPEQARRIKYGGEYYRTVAAECQCSDWNVFSIRQGKSWKEI